MAQNNFQRPEDVVLTHSLIVICEGEGGVLGHPQEFLHIQHDTGDVICPYCDRRYVWEPA